MKAAVITDLGGRETFQVEAVADPKPKADEALIDIVYCGLNHLDVLIRQGKRPGPTGFPHVLGSEIVGKIASLSGNDTSFAVGDAVAVYPWMFCGVCPQCKTGNENICDNGGTLGRTVWGGYAEKIAVPVKNLMKVHEDVKLDKACAVILAGATAYHLIRRAHIRDGAAVLITGATGGVGTMVIQLLKQTKCAIIAATSNKEKERKLIDLGVHSVVSTKNLITDVKKEYPRGVDYVIDIMGGAVWSAGVECLAKNGTLVFCATTLDEPGSVVIGSAFSRQVNILGSYGGTKKDMEIALELLKKGVIDPVIDSTFTIAHAADAHEKMESQKLFGKILLTP